MEPLPPEKSRGTLEVAEYKEQRHKADELAEQNARTEAELAEKQAALRSAEQKTAKLVEIDSIETGKTVFGGKVTVSQEDWENVTALAKKEVTSKKQTKKLRKERDDAVQERDALKAKLSAVSSELAAYKQKEEDARFYSRKKMNADAQRISREEQLKHSLQKALIVIDRYGLRDEYNHTQLNTAQKKNVLE